MPQPREPTATFYNLIFKIIQTYGWSCQAKEPNTLSMYIKRPDDHCFLTDGSGQTATLQLATVVSGFAVRLILLSLLPLLRRLMVLVEW